MSLDQLLLGGLLLSVLLPGGLLLREMRTKHLDKWIWSWIKRERRPKSEGVTHVMFCIGDHFEPKWGRPERAVEQARVATWKEHYPRVARRHVDADGRHPVHTFFYPQEEYEPEHIDGLVDICRQGLGEIEVHLHHDNDTSDRLREKLLTFMSALHDSHGAASVDPDTGKPVYGFIHGNWSLDNSRCDGRYCGVNNELIVLKETGCYADFTLPSAPSETQTSKINSIYYATDDPCMPKSHDRGDDVRVGGKSVGDLMIVQGPLGLNWKNRKYGLFPRIENGDLSAAAPPIPSRIKMWVDTAIQVQGRPDWVFIKCYTHGAMEENSDMLFNGGFESLWRYLESEFNDGKHYALHYVSARELHNIIKAAEAGKAGNPNVYRDFLIQRGRYVTDGIVVPERARRVDGSALRGRLG
ncbi:MAG: hypothetical protein ACFCUJ_06515 [Thiotrichales bacterium]